ncbi:MAG: cytochrome c maturation protein CcmE [Ardenticatenaceae bacterium]|nr:cytochrome c maturation protein CcmE [Ardenticatenaceae bacterium]
MSQRMSIRDAARPRHHALTVPQARPRRAKFLVGGILILIALAYLIATAVSSSAQYYLTVAEFWDKAPTLNGRGVRVSGQVVGTSIRVDPAAQQTVSFQIVDDEAAPDRPLTVVYEGPRPDLLREEASAVVEGWLGEDRIFHADNVLLKCPSRYEAQKDETWTLQEGQQVP